MFRSSLFLWLAASSLMLAFPARAQIAGDSKEVRTMKLQLEEANLKLARATSDLRKKETALQEAKVLFEKGISDRNELSRAEDDFSAAKLGRDQAVIDLEKQRLTFLNDALGVTLERASVYRDRDGNKRVLVVIRNSSDVGKVLDEGGSYTAEQKRSLLRVENAKVSIKLNGTLIGRPFEVQLPSIALGESREVEFLLQKDSDNLVVSITYGIRTLDFPVYLEKAAGGDLLSIKPTQFSQEGVLGNTVNFDLDLESLVEDDHSFALMTANLPTEFLSSFADKTNTVSSIRFSTGDPKRTIQLRLTLPSELQRERIDQKIGFLVLAVDASAEQRVAALKSKSGGRPLTRVQFDSAHIPCALLELVPRGRAELNIDAANLFHKVGLGEPVKFALTLRNSGTVVLDRIRLTLTLPADWSASVTPEKNISLDVGSQQKVEVELLPAADAVVGDYEAKVEATTDYGARKVEAEPKQVRIQVEGRSNLLFGGLLLVVLVGLVVGVAVVTIRLSRR